MLSDPLLLSLMLMIRDVCELLCYYSTYRSLEDELHYFGAEKIQEKMFLVP